MRICFFETPIIHLIIHDIFDKKTNEKILGEVIKLKPLFHDAVTSGNKGKTFRSNKVAYYDEIYNSNRQKSPLLSELDKLFKTEKITETLISSPYPLNDFSSTNYHESQVSRYGNRGQKYKWHSDKMPNSTKRLITFVYYFNKSPPKFSGGDFQITNSPIYDGNIIKKDAKIKIIKPKNNIGIFFPSYCAHRVMETKSPKKFEDGRFSINCWIGHV